MRRYFGRHLANADARIEVLVRMKYVLPDLSIQIRMLYVRTCIHEERGGHRVLFETGKGLWLVCLFIIQLNVTFLIACFTL